MTRLWDRAASLPVPAGDLPRPELAALPADLPTVEELFTFMRDAELRFTTLRMRIEERTGTARGEHVVVQDVTIRHPGEARVLTTEPGHGLAGAYEIWLTDGESVRTYASGRKLGTQRPIRARVRGTHDPDLPGMSRVYDPLTPLPPETLPELFIHPAGYCQNVLATGICTVTGITQLVGREAIELVCRTPRAVELTADRPDFAIRIAVDRGDGVILALEETIAGRVTRDARVTVYEPEAVLQPSAFEFTFPADTTFLY